mmetsp:Transcript_24497/g.73168  ORF Transcript_24497/g.73168 Transcript_24497/m.73168 type:complete len:111 (+) Transcript_24497:62-394(+)
MLFTAPLLSLSLVLDPALMRTASMRLAPMRSVTFMADQPTVEPPVYDVDEVQAGEAQAAAEAAAAAGRAAAVARSGRSATSTLVAWLVWRHCLPVPSHQPQRQSSLPHSR